MTKTDRIEPMADDPLTCPECGALRTRSLGSPGYFRCPNGHGSLVRIDPGLIATWERRAREDARHRKQEAKLAHLPLATRTGEKVRLRWKGMRCHWTTYTVEGQDGLWVNGAYLPHPPSPLMEVKCADNAGWLRTLWLNPLSCFIEENKNDG